jgi:hypothetical protein
VRISQGLKPPSSQDKTESRSALQEMRYAAMKAAAMKASAERGAADAKAASQSRIAWEIGLWHVAASALLQTQTREQQEPHVRNITTKLAESNVDHLT